MLVVIRVKRSILSELSNPNYGILAIMKSLSLTKPLLLITVGLPGSGKSFFARQFSATFSAPVVSIDRIRHTLYENPSYGKDEASLIQSIAQIQIEELLKTQKTFLLDGAGATRAERVELRRLARESGYDILLIWVQTDQATSQYRSMKRSSRKLDDQFNQSLSQAQYEQLAKRFTAPASNEPTLVISGKHTYPTQAKIVLKRLVAPREAETKVVPIKEHVGRAPSTTEKPARRNVLIR